jgi:YVTN family beta-propeller protein
MVAAGAFTLATLTANLNPGHPPAPAAPSPSGPVPSSAAEGSGAAPAHHLAVPRHALRFPSDDVAGFRPKPSDPNDPFTAWTLDLLNGTLVRGDYVPANGISPVGATYDSKRAELFVADWGSDNVSVLTASDGALVATVPVGSGPYDLDYDPAAGEVFVTDEFSNQVSVISDVTDRVVATIPVGTAPEGLAYDSGRAEVYVTNNGSANVSVISPLSNKVGASIGVGDDPDAVAYDSATGQLFVANWGSNSVSVLSDRTNDLVATVAVEAGPDAVACDVADGTVFVADGSSDAVSVIADTNDTAYLEIPVGSGPSALAYDAGTGQVFVDAQGTDNVSVLSGSTDALVGTVEVGLAPVGIAYDNASGELFVVNGGSNNLTEISDKSDAPAAEFPLGAFPLGVAVDGGAGDFAVAENDSQTLTVIAQRNDMVQAAPTVGVGPSGVAYDGGQGELFVANNGSNTVSVVSDANDLVVATVEVGAGPVAVAYDSGRAQIFVANANNTSDTVSVISTTTDAVVATIPVGSSPDAVAYDSDRGEVFVANNLSSTVSVISDTTDKVVATIPVGPNPDGLAYDGGAGEVFVADRGSDNVSVISDANDKVLTVIPVGFFPAGLAYDSGRGQIYVANELSDNVSVISDSDNEVVATVSVGLSPEGVAYDAATSQVLVTNFDSGTLSLISDGSATSASALLTAQAMNSTGDPVGGATVSAGGQTTLTDANGTAQFLLPNGTYNVSVSAPEYLSTYATVDLSGQDNVTLTLGYPYDFLGVLPDSDWSLAAVYAGVNVTIRSPFATSAADVFFDWKLVGALPAGSSGTGFVVDQVPDLVVVAAEPRTADSPDAYYFLPSGLSGGGCGAFPEGAGASPPVSVSPNPPLYGQPTVITVGLHDSCSYALHIDDLEVDVANFNAGGATYVPVGAVRNISLTAGQYSNVSVLWNTTFNASDYGYHHCVRIQVVYGSPVPPQGNFISGLHNLDIEPNILAGTSGSVGFTVRNPAATSQEIEIVVATRLPSGWTDEVELNGAMDSSPYYNFSLGAGGSVSGMLTITPDASTPGNGSVQVQEYYASNGTLIGGLQKTLQELAPGRYPVDFTESGLGAGQNWSISFDGKMLTSNQTTIYANASDGSYPFSVTPVTGYQSSPSSGTVTVNGATVTEPIAFTYPSGCYVFTPGSLGVASGLSTPDLDSDDSSATISFSGGITLTPSFNLCVGPIGLYATFPYLEPAYVNVTESLTESATATLTATGEVDYSNLDQPYTFPGTTVFLPCIFIGPVPVCVDSSIVLGIEADLTLTGQISLDQGVTLATSQNYSAATGKWTDTGLTPSCVSPGALLADGCATISTSTSIAGSLQVMLGPQININIAELGGVYLTPYVGLNVSGGASTGGGEPGPCGGDSFGWRAPLPWLAVCGLVGIQGGVDLSIPDVVDFDLEGFDWTPFAAPLGASVAVCGSGSTTCDGLLSFTPDAAVTLQAESPVTDLTYGWSGSCLSGPETGSTATFVAPSSPGTCSLTVTTGLPLTWATIDLSEIELQVRVSPAESLTFTESGLTSGSTWSVTAGSEGTTQSTSGKSLAFTEPQGLVAYTAVGPLGYSSSVTTPASATSPVNVSGPTTVTIKFGHLQSLSFHETGLPPGHVWNVTIASAVKGGPPSQNLATSNSSVTLTVVADPYSWTVRSSSTDYQPTPSHGTVGVGTSAKVEKVKFKEITSKVTFSEKGLPAHSHWAVTITGMPTLNGTGASITLHLPNGTYSYTLATTRVGYTTDQQTGTVKVVAPKPLKLTITFTDPPG